MAAVCWYIALGLIGVKAAVFVLYKKKNYYEFTAFFLFAMMFAFVCEMVVLLFFNSYSYKPGIYTDYYAPFFWQRGFFSSRADGIYTG